MLSINSNKTVPALVHSGATSNASTTPCSTAPATPTSETTSVNFPFPLNKRSSMGGLKAGLAKFRRSTKSMLNRTAKSKPLHTEPSISVPDKILVEQETVIEFCPALRPQYQETDEPRGSYLYIPLPRFPSQVSLIPLHDGHVLPSPAAEHDGEDITSFASLACLTERRDIHHVESNPSVSFVAAPFQMSSSVLVKTFQAASSEPFLDSLAYPTEQTQMNFPQVEYNQSLYSMADSSQTSSTGVILERSSTGSHTLVYLSYVLIFTCIITGVAAILVSGHSWVSIFS